MQLIFLCRQLELKSDVVRKLEAANSERGRKLENIKGGMSGNIAEHRSVNGSSDALDRYSEDLMEHLRQNAPLIERLQLELDSAQVSTVEMIKVLLQHLISLLLKAIV